MEQYISKSAVVAEIEKRRSKNARNKLNLASAFEDNYLLSFLDTLETKEVDLEKDVDIEDAVHGTVDFPLIGCDFPNIYPNYKELKEYCDRKGIKDNDKVYNEKDITYTLDLNDGRKIDLYYVSPLSRLYDKDGSHINIYSGDLYELVDKIYNNTHCTL